MKGVQVANENLGKVEAPVRATYEQAIVVANCYKSPSHMTLDS